MHISRHALTSLAAALALALPAASHAQWPFLGSPAPATVASAPATAPVQVIHLEGPLSDATSGWTLWGAQRDLTWPSLWQTLDRVATSSEVKTVVLKVGAFSPTLAQAQELAALLTRLRQTHKKRVVAYAETLTTATLIAIAPADTLWLTPEGSALLPGLQLEVLFYKDLLAPLGIEADIEAVGDFKSAMEPLTRSTMSDAAHENLESLLDDLFASLTTALRARPRLNADQARALIDRGLLSSDDALKAGLVDRLGYWDEALAAETKRAGDAALAWPEAQSGPEITSLFDLMRLFLPSEKAPDDAPKIALIVAEGAIVSGRSAPDPFQQDGAIAAEDFLDTLAAVTQDPAVRAIVLRINSPGGSALASDLLWRAVRDVSAKLPVVVSLGSVAASGGYYLAVAGKPIFAEPTTLTGSIGVFGGKLVYRGLLDKFDVHAVTLSRGKNAGLLSGLTRFSDSERAAFRGSLERTYQTFVNRVAQGRGMGYDRVHKLAQGRVWSGKQALEVGLVDALGGLDDAIRAAAQRAKLGDSFQVERFPRTKTLFEVMSERNSDPRRLQLADLIDLSAPLGDLPKLIQALLRHGPSVLALQPFHLQLH